MSNENDKEDWSITILLAEIGLLIGIILVLLKILPALAHT
ncbi:hypothetical protein SJAV_01970 [Sulfurisphaera javensis]|uniref:Uncharacterized protein n=1 Tax=Sulfurisphaera javensis TaxID=2049879 RepID=A0AAT9GNG8_9CREN